jgi:hypothetical protein
VVESRAYKEQCSLRRAFGLAVKVSYEPLEKRVEKNVKGNVNAEHIEQESRIPKEHK